MSDQLKRIVARFNEKPYNKNFNLISFDALSSEQLLQILNDVLTEIDPKQQGDVRDEDPTEMAVRMLGMLRVLKYQPSSSNMSDFRQGLVSGEKHIVYPILDWMLDRIPELQKRAYLAKYLVKIDIPMDILQDDDVALLNDQYENLVENFKIVHKEAEALRNSGFSTAELRKDILQMEEEKDVVISRIERLKLKVDGIPSHETLLSSVQTLRVERDREKQIASQKAELKTTLAQGNQKTQRLQQTLLSLRQASVGTTPEGLIQRLQDERNVMTYIVNEKLPKELASTQQTVNNLQKVALEPAMGHSELNAIRKKIENINAETSRISEKRLADAKDEEKDGQLNLGMFRQQAAMIARKKEAMVDKMNDLKTDIQSLSDEYEEKKSSLSDSSGGAGAMVRPEEFKRYVSSLRNKSTVYKQKRAELSDLRAEYGVLSRSLEILNTRHKTLTNQMNAEEDQKGVPGFRQTKDTLEKVSTQKSDLDQEKGNTLNDISVMVSQLNHKIAERKAHLAPIIKELRPLRQKVQEMTMEYEEKKHAFDSASAGFDSSIHKLSVDVKGLEETVAATESRFHTLQARRELLLLQQQKLNDEIKLYISTDPNDKKQSVREQLTSRIAEAERRGKTLKEQQKNIKDTHLQNVKQKQMWLDLERLMQCKMRCMEEENQNRVSAKVHHDPQGETMVL